MTDRISPRSLTSALERIDRLARQYDLSPRVRSQLGELLRFVAGEDTVPTTVKDPLGIVDAHLADSLTALDLQEVHSVSRIADIGAGAGFPGLVLAAALAEARVCLIESIGRKCRFISAAAESAGIANVSVVCSRIEQWREGIIGNDVVTARAVAPLAVLLEYAMPLLVVGGSLIAWKGAVSAEERRDAELAAGLLGAELQEVLRVKPFKGSTNHHLYVYRKVTTTPDRFPRRAGLARKRPLVRGGKVAR